MLCASYIIIIQPLISEAVYSMQPDFKIMGSHLNVLFDIHFRLAKSWNWEMLIPHCHGIISHHSTEGFKFWETDHL